MRTQLLKCFNPKCDNLVEVSTLARRKYCSECKEKDIIQHHGLRVFYCPADENGIPYFNVGVVFTTYEFFETLKYGYWPYNMGVVFKRKRYRVRGTELVDKNGDVFFFDNKRLVKAS